MKTRVTSMVLDLLAGFLALGVFFVLDGYVHVAADLRSATFSLAVLCLFAGFIRGRNGSAWRKVLLVSAGGGLPLLALGSSAIDHTVLAIFLLIVVLFAFCGVLARKHWAARLPARGSLTILVPLAALGIIDLTVIPQLGARIATRKVASAAPQFTVARLDGTVASSADWHGRVVVVDYWATWCPACRRELPELQMLYRRYQNDPKVLFWAVDVQTGGESPEKASTFIKRAGYTLPIAIDSENSEERLARQLAFGGFPALILIDRDGKVRLVHIGYDRSERLVENLSKEIDTLLKEPA